jgi:hypothetical protein
VDQTLRPSIFTTIAAHMDKENARQPEAEHEPDKADDEWTNV